MELPIHPNKSRIVSMAAVGQLTPADVAVAVCNELKVSTENQEQILHLVNV